MTAWLLLTDVTAAGYTADQSAVDAVVAYVPNASPETRACLDGAAFTPTADIKFGAVMLAARWHARRSTLMGTAGYTEFGTATIMRHDPDIARLLGLGNYSRVFSFGAPSLPVEEEE